MPRTSGGSRIVSLEQLPPKRLWRPSDKNVPLFGAYRRRNKGINTQSKLIFKTFQNLHSVSFPDCNCCNDAMYKPNILLQRFRHKANNNKRFQHQDTTRLTEPNLIANCFTGKSISCLWRTFCPVNWKQMLTGELLKNTQTRHRETTQTTVSITRYNDKFGVTRAKS